MQLKADHVPTLGLVSHFVLSRAIYILFCWTAMLTANIGDALCHWFCQKHCIPQTLSQTNFSYTLGHSATLSTSSQASSFLTPPDIKTI